MWGFGYDTSNRNPTPSSMYTKDEYGLLIGNIPYIGVKVKAENIKKIENKMMEFYVSDGRTLFEVKDENGNPTGDAIFFVVFK